MKVKEKQLIQPGEKIFCPQIPKKNGSKERNAVTKRVPRLH